MDLQESYPARWEADVLLRDGRAVHVRPIRPDDAARLLRFHAQLSEDALYARYFAPHPRLTEREVAHLTTVDYDGRVALVALLADELIGVVRYEREGEEPGAPAEVAFLVADAHQGRGLASVLLEHLAAAARERGVGRFVAEVLATNRSMAHVFAEAGYSVRRELADGVVTFTLDLADTETSIAVRQAREQRAEARSVRQLLHPRSIVVIGASRRTNSIGQTVLRHLRDGGFAGTLAAVHPQVNEIAGVPAYRSVLDVPGEVDLAVVAVRPDDAEQVVADCGRKGVRGLVVVAAGYAETGDPEGFERQHRLVRLAHGHGMRVVGPTSFGIINTDQQVRLNASAAPVVPEPGRVGMFAQSGALGVAILASARRRGLGMSTFVSAGNRADVSGNDLLQYWEQDPATDTVLLYLESLGNPRKFRRLARRIGQHKPIVAVKSGRSGSAGQAAPLGHTVRESRAPLAAVDALFRSSGVLRVDDIHELFDVGQLLADQPLPAGRRVRLVGNSDALGLIAADALTAAGLDVVGEPASLGPEAGAAQFEAALDAALADEGTDAVVVVFFPPLMVLDEDVAQVVATASAKGAKTVVSSFLGMRGLSLLGSPDGAVPSYPTPEDAVRALSVVTEYAQWRRRAQGSLPEVAGLAPGEARVLVEKLLAGLPAGTGGAGDPADADYLGPAETAALLGHYGIEVWPARAARSPDDAVEAAEELGYPVVLKATLPRLRHLPELGQVRLGLQDEGDVRGAYAGMVDALGPEAIGNLAVQHQAPAGTAVVITSMEDPLFGPIVSFGLGGLATELLGDRAYGIPPLTDVDAAELVRSVRAAPLLLGARGRPADVAAVEDLVLRVSRLADDLPEVAELELNPVLVAPRGLVVLGARVRLAHPLVRTDRGPRALP